MSQIDKNITKAKVIVKSFILQVTKPERVKNKIIHKSFFKTKS